MRTCYYSVQVACPYFMPRLPLAGFSDLYNGECATQSGASIAADLLRVYCNNGYARQVCVYAAESESDAFRLLIQAERDGTVDVAWSSERNHHPVAVGCLKVNPTEEARTPLEWQAHACASAYLRQTGRN